VLFGDRKRIALVKVGVNSSQSSFFYRDLSCSDGVFPFLKIMADPLHLDIASFIDLFTN
jgi:hypothetical protein